MSEFNRKLWEYLDRSGFTSETLSYSGAETAAVAEARQEAEKKILIEKGIDKELISTPEYVVMIHRTSESAHKIFLLLVLRREI